MEASSAEGRAKAAVTFVAEERKVSNALIAGLQNDFSSLQSFITGLCRPLIGKPFFLCLQQLRCGVVGVLTAGFCPQAGLLTTRRRRSHTTRGSV